ncbi:MAG TPA: DUF1501 domain-containing protein, partial [Gemmataceae bacterium]|nr:DUF1501 domain-containing protein [Gemmataceae bacterium]
MLFLGRQRQRTCSGLSRRSFLQVGGSTVLGLTLADLLRLRATAGTPSSGSAKSVILLWLWGGPSHLDTFDPKPNAPIEYRGPFSTIPTKTTGVRVTELFPKIAALSDQYALIRSMNTQSNDHGVAGTIGLTGSMTGAVDLGGKMSSGTVRPATGAVVAKARLANPAREGGRVQAAATPNTPGLTAGVRHCLPPFMVIGGKLHQGKKA